MATQVQNRRGSTAEHSTFTGAVAELTVDTTKDVVVVHDGSTAGGFPMLRQDQANLPTSAPSNGVYLPSSNNVAISTNGTGRLFVDSTGRVGINTASPGYALHVTDVNTDGVPLRLTSSQSTSRLQFESTGGGGTVYIGATSSAFTVQTSGSGFSEKLRVTSDGRLGLGTSTARAGLTVARGSNGIPAVGTTDGSAVFSNAQDLATYGLVLGAATTGKGYIQVQSTNGTSDVYDLLLQPNGANVGIGTTSPQGPLDVVTGSSGAIFRFDSASTWLNILPEDANGVVALRYRANSGSAPDLVFRNDAGTETGRLTNDGKLLVGTSSDSLTSSVVVQGNSASTGGPGVLRLCSGASTPADGGDIGVVNFGADNHQTAASIFGVRDGGTWTPGTSQPTRLVFSTTADGASSPTERVRITNYGALWVGNTTRQDTDNHTFTALSGADWTAAFRSAGAVPAGIYIKYTAASPNGTGSPFLRGDDSGGTTRFEIRSNGGLANFSANNVNLSDINSKKDITPAAGTWDCLKEWEIVNFRYKDQPNDADLNMGVIAQQVAESCPEVITIFQEAKEATETEPAQEERLGVKDQQMMWMAIKALQEAQLRIETLEAEVAALKGV